MNSLLRLCAVCCCLLWPLTSSAISPDQNSHVFSFGLVPQQSASKLARLWTPILLYLSDKTGYKFHFKTAKDIPTFEKRLAKGDYDFAYMNPYHYTVFSHQPGYRVFAKEKDTDLRGIVVVRKDSSFNDIKQLHKRVLAFPAPAAFAASVLTRTHLARDGVVVEPKYVMSHDSVYRSVAKGLYPAGGGIVRTLDVIDPEIGEQLRILYTTDAYTPHAITAHKRVDPAVAGKVQQVMLAMDKDPKGIKLLKNINFKGISVAKDKDYKDIRRLGITALNHYMR